ncbi:MAG: hypothetical protein M4579_002186 [Chaenotheca gracillima]|nr:MAG: hypothetical protein M4579_002186 [Chaenotheca gracillima]
MADNPPDERLVYLSCRRIFEGDKSKLRKLNLIKQMILDNKDSVQDVIEQHNIDSVCNTARRLLKKHVFQSECKAKMRFPGLFDVSPREIAKRVAWEVDAPISETKILKGASGSRYELRSKQAGTTVERTKKLDKKAGTAIQSTKKEDEKAITSVQKTKDVDFPPKKVGKKAGISYRPSTQGDTKKYLHALYPVYIHYKAQHQLLVTVQAIMEEALYAFGETNIPEVLIKHSWDCPESAELNEWPKVFRAKRDLLPVLSPELEPQLDRILEQVSQLRHNAVHRVRMTAKGIEKLIKNAELFLDIIRDTPRLERIGAIRCALQSSVEDLQRNKDILETRTQDQFRLISDRRAELDRLEEAAVASMVREDAEYLRGAGQCLNDVLTQTKSLKTFPRQDRNRPKLIQRLVVALRNCATMSRWSQIQESWSATASLPATRILRSYLYIGSGLPSIWRRNA